MVKTLAQLEAFEEFKTNILPALQADLKDGATPEQLRQKYAAHLQARIITAALIEADSSKALAAAKDVLDRTEGKAKERIETTHKLERLKDEELDAILLSELDDVEQLTSGGAADEE